jgi:hypothetical protein
VSSADVSVGWLLGGMSHAFGRGRKSGRIVRVQATATNAPLPNWILRQQENLFLLGPGLAVCRVLLLAGEILAIPTTDPFTLRRLIVPLS